MVRSEAFMTEYLIERGHGKFQFFFF